MRYYKLATPRVLLFLFFTITGIIYFFKKDINELGLNELLTSITLLVILIFLISSKFLNLKSEKINKSKHMTCSF